MNFFNRTAFLLLLTTQCFAVTTTNLEKMRENVIATKSVFLSQCHGANATDIIKQNLGEYGEKCASDAAQVARLACQSKLEMTSYLEAILADRNIQVVAKRFSATPAPDALGGVLLWQMKSSLNQVNQNWSNAVDKFKNKKGCYVAARKDLVKKLVLEISNSIKADLEQITLNVETLN